MEDLFIPATRLRDLLIAEDPNTEDFLMLHLGDLDRLDEVELTAQGAEAFVNGTWTWQNLHEFSRGKNALWLGPHAFLRGGGGIGLVEVRGFDEVGTVMVHNLDGRADLWLRLYLSSNEPSINMCDLLVPFFSNCEGQVWLRAELGVPPPLPRILDQMLPQLSTSDSLFVSLVLYGFSLDEGTCRMLDVDTREGFQLDLQSCCTPTEEVTRILLDLIRRNRGPTSLSHCSIDTVTLTDALRGNTSVKELRLGDGYHNGNITITSLRALGDNVGLTELKLLLQCRLSDDVWTEMCQSLGGHPNLKLLHVENTATHDESSIPQAGGVASCPTHEGPCAPKLLWI